MTTQSCYSYFGYSIFCDSRVALSAALVLGLLVGFVAARRARKGVAVLSGVAIGLSAFALLLPARGSDSGSEPEAPASNSSAAGASCVITNAPRNGIVTRYEAGPEGRAWWVSYAVLTNPCDQPATLTSLEQSGVLQPGFDWSGRAYVRPIKNDMPLDAFAAQLSSSEVPMVGFALQPGESVQVMAEVTLLNALTAETQVPSAMLGWRMNGQMESLALQPTIRFCNCKIEAASSNQS